MANALAERPAVETPPLCNGDNLTREEFERLWDLHPEIKHAELINGIVHLELSVSPEHATKHVVAVCWLGTYWAGRPGMEAGDNGTVRFADGNDMQPDAVLRRTEGAGGRSFRSKVGIEGPPELAFEVSYTSASYDLHQKFDVYERNGVGEYIVWQLHENRLDWFVLRNGRYERHLPDGNGVIESVQFPGLRLNVPMLLAGDLAGVLRTLAG